MGLGWSVTVYRQGAVPATLASPKGEKLASWDVPVLGLKWLDDLVRAGKAIYLGGDGYPIRYTALAHNLADEPPAWGWGNEWILVEAWDQS